VLTFLHQEMFRLAGQGMQVLRPCEMRYQYRTVTLFALTSAAEAETTDDVIGDT
jgi:hypothetical protein